MLNENFVIILVVIGLIGMSVYCLKERKGFVRTILYLLFVVYIGVVISITLFPIPIDHNPLIPHDDFAQNFIPFASISETISEAFSSSEHWQLYAIILAGNVLMFTPLGFMVPYISLKKRKFWKTLIVVFLCTLLIELAQLGISLWVGYFYRVIDIDDIILNTVGGMIGYFIFWVAFKLIGRVSKRKIQTSESL